MPNIFETENTSKFEVRPSIFSSVTNPLISRPPFTEHDGQPFMIGENKSLLMPSIWIIASFIAFDLKVWISAANRRIDLSVSVISKLADDYLNSSEFIKKRNPLGIILIGHLAVC